MLKYPHSIDIYDHILAKVSVFEDYSFHEKDHPGGDLFNLFVSATDALRIDHTELFLYCNGKEQYLFMTQEDFDYYGYVQESCQ